LRIREIVKEWLLDKISLKRELVIVGKTGGNHIIALKIHAL
jgi:hypothetical protein